MTVRDKEYMRYEVKGDCTIDCVGLFYFSAEFSLIAEKRRISCLRILYKDHGGEESAGRCISLVWLLNLLNIKII